MLPNFFYDTHSYKTFDAANKAAWGKDYARFLFVSERLLSWRLDNHSSTDEAEALEVIAKADSDYNQLSRTGSMSGDFWDMSYQFGRDALAESIGGGISKEGEGWAAGALGGVAKAGTRYLLDITLLPWLRKTEAIGSWEYAEKKRMTVQADAAEAYGLGKYMAQISFIDPTIASALNKYTADKLPPGMNWHQTMDRNIPVTAPTDPASLLPAQVQTARRQTAGPPVCTVNLNEIKTYLDQKYDGLVKDYLGPTLDLVKSANAKLDYISGQIGIIRSDVDSIKNNTDEILAWVKAQKDREAQARERAKTEAVTKLAFEGYEAALSIATTLIAQADPKLAQQVNASGKFALTVAASVMTFAKTLEQALGKDGLGGVAAALGGAVLTGNILSAATTLAAALSGQPSTDQLILKQLAAIQKQIADLGEQMDKRFDRVDAELRQVMRGLGDILTELQTDRQHIDAVLGNTYELLGNVQRLETNMNRYFEDLLVAEPNTRVSKAITTENLAYGDSDHGFRGAIGGITAFLTSPAFLTGDIATGGQRPTEDPALEGQLKYGTAPPAQNLIYLDAALSQRGWPSFADGRPLINSDLWGIATSGLSYLCMTQPNYALSSAEAARALSTAVSTGQEIRDAVHHIWFKDWLTDHATVKTDLLGKLMANYREKFMAVIQKAADIEVQYLSTKAIPYPHQSKDFTGGTRDYPINLWNPQGPIELTFPWRSETGELLSGVTWGSNPEPLKAPEGLVEHLPQWVRLALALDKGEQAPSLSARITVFYDELVKVWRTKLVVDAALLNRTYEKVLLVDPHPYLSTGLPWYIVVAYWTDHDCLIKRFQNDGSPDSSAEYHPETMMPAEIGPKLDQLIEDCKGGILKDIRDDAELPGKYAELNGAVALIRTLMELGCGQALAADDILRGLFYGRDRIIDGDLAHEWYQSELAQEGVDGQPSWAGPSARLRDTFERRAAALETQIGAVLSSVAVSHQDQCPPDVASTLAQVTDVQRGLNGTGSLYPPDFMPRPRFGDSGRQVRRLTALLRLALAPSMQVTETDTYDADVQAAVDELRLRWGLPVPDHVHEEDWGAGPAEWRALLGLGANEWPPVVRRGDSGDAAARFIALLRATLPAGSAVPDTRTYTDQIDVHVQDLRDRCDLGNSDIIGRYEWSAVLGMPGFPDTRPASAELVLRSDEGYYLAGARRLGLAAAASDALELAVVGYNEWQPGTPSVLTALRQAGGPYVTVDDSSQAVLDAGEITGADYFEVTLESAQVHVRLDTDEQAHLFDSPFEGWFDAHSYLGYDLTPPITGCYQVTPCGPPGDDPGLDLGGNRQRWLRGSYPVSIKGVVLGSALSADREDPEDGDRLTLASIDGTSLRPGAPVRLAAEGAGPLALDPAGFLRPAKQEPPLPPAELYLTFSDDVAAARKGRIEDGAAIALHTHDARVLAIDPASRRLVAVPDKARQAWFTCTVENRRPSRLRRPRPVAPVAAERLTKGGTILQWDEVHGATRYNVDIQMRTGTDTYVQVAKATTAGRQLAVEALLPPTFCAGRWRVTAVDGAGRRQQSRPGRWAQLDYRPYAERPARDTFLTVMHVAQDAPAVHYVDDKQHLHELRREQGQWWGIDISERTGTATTVWGGGAVAIGDQGKAALFYLNPQRHVCRLVPPADRESGSWEALDLTAAIGAPDAGAPALTAATAGDSSYVYFMDGNAQLTELTLAPEHTSWARLPAQLEQVQRPSLAASASAAGRRVYALNKDAHIVEFRAANQWLSTDIIEKAGSPACAGGFTVTEDDLNGQRLVYYVTSAGHLIELRSESDDAWGWTDLTSNASGARPADPASAVAAANLAGVPHVLVIDDRSHLCELWPEDGSWRVRSHSQIWVTSRTLAAHAITNAARTPLEVYFVRDLNICQMECNDLGEEWQNANLDPPPRSYIVSTGSAVLSAQQSLDALFGFPCPKDDPAAHLLWLPDYPKQSGRSAIPLNRARIAFPGSRDFASLTLDHLRSLDYRQDSCLQVVPQGSTIIAIHTSSGHYSKILLVPETRTTRVHVEWVTYDPSCPSTATVNLSIVPGEYRVTHIARDIHGDIDAFRCINVRHLYTVELRVTDVIPLITSGHCQFYVEEPAGKRAALHVVHRLGRTPYLATNHDGVITNNLSELPHFDAPKLDLIMDQKNLN